MAILSVYNQRLARLLEARPVILQILRFAAIGTINTALDFIILNYITKSFGVTEGFTLGALNMVGFTAAMIQSYFWNRAWTFHSFNISPLANAIRLMIVGGLGLFAFLLVMIGSIQGAMENYYLFILVVFIVSEILVWYAFGLKLTSNNGEDGKVAQQFASFMIVSFIGLLINSGIVALASSALAPSLSSFINEDSVKNVAKILATGLSLIWNFMAYKLFVFKR
ncbi:MAG TPA: GtrA family protein [Candidatus Doudnabacteria bacterium]|nr:GtrA family protein [Candidatus Doudnabacteria bacterium]